ncbi:MAG: hypothetical protein GC153_03005 [Alphaproteobacteria bacterium]|nr:hypothetical protein [Alphaproteobacteria bacterium]
MRRTAAFIIFVACALLIGAADADARTIEVSSRHCAVRPDAAPYFPPANISAPQLGPRLDIGAGMFVWHDERVSSGTSENAVARFLIEPSSGLPLGFMPAANCAKDALK